MGNQLPFIYIKSLVRYILLRKYSNTGFNFETANCVNYNFQYFCGRSAICIHINMFMVCDNYYY